jgi:hypothetical protein
MCFMPKVSRERAPDVTDYGPAEDRGAQLDGYAVIFTSIREDWDLTPLLKGLPGDSCPCPHWGYVTAGRRGVGGLSYTSDPARTARAVGSAGWWLRGR